MSSRIQVKYVQSLREITLIFGHNVLLLVINKTISIQNIFARIGYYKDDGCFIRTTTVPAVRITTFYKCSSITGESHLVTIHTDTDKVISFVEILDAQSKTAHYLLLKVAEYHNPYRPQKQKYVEVIRGNEVHENENDFLNRVYNVSYDILGEENITEKETDDLCESLPIMTRQDDPVWVEGDSEISLAWSHNTHWKTTCSQFGVCTDKKGWVVCDSYELVSTMNRVAEDMLNKSICNLRLIQDETKTICTPKHIALSPNEALQLATVMVLKAIINRPKQEITIRRQSFGPGHVFMHIAYDHLYNTKDPFHVFKNTKLAKRIGVSDIYLETIRYIMGIEEENKCFYVQNGDLLPDEPHISTRQTAFNQLASLQKVQQFGGLYQDKIDDLVQEILDDVIFKVCYDGQEMVITSDVLPEHTILFAPHQEIEMSISNRVLYIAEKSPIIFSYVKLFKKDTT